MSRIVVVTGAASGIGRGLALHFGHAGERVVGFDLDGGGLNSVAQEARGGAFLPIVGSIGDADDIDRCVSTAEAEFGTIDLVINNAGTTGGPRATTVHETSVEGLNLVLSVNIIGPFLMCRRVLPSMVEKGAGVIINIASVAGMVAFPRRAAYSVSKAAMIQLTKSIAVDYAHVGIRTVALCPGMIQTPLTQWRLDDPALRAEVLARIPQGRIGAIDDVIAAVDFLSSDKADYFNGAALAMDGGYTAF